MSKKYQKIFSGGRNAGFKPFFRHAEPLRAVVCASNQKGFTLIELLVVVLIIGILASVALPQYQKAVEKSRATEALVNLRSIVQSVQLYKMANGEATRDWDALDVIPEGTRTEDGKIVLNNFTYSIGNLGAGAEGFEAIATRNDADKDIMKYYIYFSYVGTMNCVAMTKAAEAPCSVVCGKGTFKEHVSSYTICHIS